MDLCSLHADIRMLSDRILCSEIPLKRMTTLMRDDVHITAGTVKVSEDKRCMVQRQISHVTASFLGLAAQYVKQLVLHHEIKNSAVSGDSSRYIFWPAAMISSGVPVGAGLPFLKYTCSSI